MEENISEQVEEIINDENKVEKEESLEDKIEKLEAEINEWKKEYAIKLADFENYKKRKDKEFSEYKKYACESLIVKQVESIDVLSMATQSARSNHDMDALLEGLEMLKNGMITYLKEEGLEEIIAENEKYDPYSHQAVSTVSNEDMENDVIVSVLQKGYKLKGKVIRPAMVVINKK
ncbi:nucleotide exchange factor GrpE [Oceanivirga miroungae]|uniref:Protein GrpE n=1 Tax=Oceanivirga miroungae TaxID=1130046 RepID=A0A6I8ME29_9FUSO|nr:nucleotide exchange factor GrpE [Oceanivirga miroungae]VWL85819.1 GrpE protein HSP-70 cofactor [Oceanivirga miroungae]